MKKCSLAMILILRVLLSCLTAVAGRVDKVELSSHNTIYYSVQERLKNVTDEKRNIEEVIAELLSLHPSARIRVVNETLHVVIDDPALSIEKAENDRATSVYAPMGGAFRDFSVPSYSMMIPLTQVYMSAQAVQARLEQLSNPAFWRWVKQELVYSPWNSNHCTTQGGFNASWYGGDYEF